MSIRWKKWLREKENLNCLLKPIVKIYFRTTEKTEKPEELLKSSQSMNIRDQTPQKKDQVTI